MATYGPRGDPYESVERTLEHWLTERYCLYAAAADGRLFRSEIHHAPWPLQRAEAGIETNTMLDGFGLTRSAAPHELHYASRIDVVVWDPYPIEAR